MGTRTGASSAWPGATSAAAAASSSAAVAVADEDARLRGCGRGPGPSPTARPRPSFRPPGSGGVAAGPDDGRVDPHPPGVGEPRVGRHRLEPPADAGGRHPPAEPVGRGLPPAELGRPVPPRDAGPGQGRQGRDDVPVGEVRVGASRGSRGVAGQGPEGRPEVVRDHGPRGRDAQSERRENAKPSGGIVCTVNRP